MTRVVQLGRGGEFDIVRRMLARWGELADGIGDDAAILDAPAGEHLVISTDSSVEHVHFRGDWLTASEIGYRATTGALSDLAAMAARPLGVTIALSMPRAWVAHADELADGIGEAARLAETRILGGDITRASELGICVTVLGAVSRPLRRDAARPGDVVYVTGTLGGPMLAVRAWERGLSPDPTSRARFAHPVARLAESRWLGGHGAHAAIDISDGLLGDAGQLAAASGVRILLNLDALPTVLGASAADAAQSGEESELVVTAPAELDAPAFEARFGIPLTAIGSIIAGVPAVEATVRGERVAWSGGFDHFS